MEIKPITIKAHPEDKSFIDNLVKSGQCKTMAEAFSYVVTMAKKAAGGDTSEETAAQLADLNSLLETKAAELQTALQTIEAQKIVLEENDKLINQLTNQAPEIREVEVVKEVEKTLTGSQFICELDEQTALNARKIRSFAKADGLVNTTTGTEYINQLVNAAVKKFLAIKYDHLL